ncbi:MAG: 30S ribosomal protein S9 [Candidatus Saccharibacteria bacterium]|nr:30S ribosomal protein S9 [Candidatus Saccharibacteria bacterium]
MATTDTKHYNYALGRRKSATARIRLMNGKGNFTVNGKEISDFLEGSKFLANELQKPFNALELDNKKYDISAVVTGGGQHGQVEAMRLAIAKAFVAMNEDYRSTLRRADLLGRDPREKERKKFGLKGARKQRQFTKR